MTSIIAMASADPDLQIPAGWFRMPFLLWPFERWSTSNLDSSCRSTSRFRPSRFAELAESCGKNGGFHINSPPKNITLDLPEKMMLHRFWGVPWYTTFSEKSKEASSSPDTAVPQSPGPNQAPFETVLRWQSDEPKAAGFS